MQQGMLTCFPGNSTLYAHLCSHDCITRSNWTNRGNSFYMCDVLEPTITDWSFYNACER